MELLIAIDEAEGTSELESLHDWISHERLPVSVDRGLQGGTIAGTMGDANDLLVILGPGGAAAGISACIIAWLRTRRSSVRLRIQVGKKVTQIDARNLTKEQSAELLEAFINGDFDGRGSKE